MHYKLIKILKIPRYQFSKKTTLRADELEKIGIQMKKPGEVTLETEYEKVKTLDIDNWENKRGKKSQLKI